VKLDRRKSGEVFFLNLVNVLGQEKCGSFEHGHAAQYEMFVGWFVGVPRFVEIQEIHEEAYKKKKAADRLMPGGLLKMKPYQSRKYLRIRTPMCQESSRFG